MPQKVLKFTGVNRRVNEFQNSGACEELINLRPEIGGGHSVVKPKLAKEETFPYIKMYEHVFGSNYNRVAVMPSGSIDWINSDRGIVNITNKFKSDDITICFAGNVMVAYSEKEKLQLVFKFEDGYYNDYNLQVKAITSAKIRYDYRSSDPAKNIVTSSSVTTTGITQMINSAASGFYEKFPNGLCGAAIVGCAYEMDDGSELWSTAFVVANVERCEGYEAPECMIPTEPGNGGYVVYGANYVYLDLTFNLAHSAHVKKINVYSTRPVIPYRGGQFSDTGILIDRIQLEDSGLDGQIMYYQGSVSIESQSASLLLNFSSTLAGEQLMNVSNAPIERIGTPVSYNNRFHYYRSEVNHILQVPTVAYEEDSSDQYVWVAYVNINNEWRLIPNKIYRFSPNKRNDFVYPMAGIKQIAFVRGEYINGNFTVTYGSMTYITLRDSSAYNYSYAFDVLPSEDSAGHFYDEVSRTGQLWGNEVDTKVFWKKETNVINVSNPFNPFVFPVKYSYSFTGEILDLATSYLPISATQVGQYPLSVFTSNGIYALEQGSGEVLYGNITPLQPLVINGKATSTPFGTFFISSKSLYLLSGRESANVSYVLNGERELTLRELDSYQSLACNKRGVFFDFSPLLSGEDFKDFIDDATLVYDQLNNELYICSGNESVPYSYVLNLDTKAYHKVSKRYLPVQSGSRYAIESNGSSRTLVDLHNEVDTEQHILLQSRPMSLEMAFTHIQRLILLADTKLTGTQNLCISVFASDNLYDWKCIISAQKQKTALRQICTNRAAKSFRDYVILITGTVDTDTDISNIIADYTIVNRRLG